MRVRIRIVVSCVPVQCRRWNMIDGIPSDVVTLLISVSDGDQIKYVLLGEWNRMTIQSSHTTYRILNANSVLEQVLDFLQIDKGSDS